MPHARLTHPARSTLPFRQGQSDEYSREAVADITAEIGVDRAPLVHMETRQSRSEIRGRVTAPRRARNDATTSNWRQSLANYVDLLESHVDEFQGTGYIYENDQLNTAKQAILESVAWEVGRGQPYEVDFDASIAIGSGVFEGRSIDRRNPTVDTAQDPYLIIDGVACPGMRQYRKTTGMNLTVRPVFDRDSAENNDVMPDASGGVVERIEFRGTHTGDQATRASADSSLEALVGTLTNVTCQTKFPGYDLDGYVTGYQSTFRSAHGTDRHDYQLTFVVGQRA